MVEAPVHRETRELLDELWASHPCQHSLEPLLIRLFPVRVLRVAMFPFFIALTAQAAGDTMSRIRETRTIVLGVARITALLPTR